MESGVGNAVVAATAAFLLLFPTRLGGEVTSAGFPEE